MSRSRWSNGSGSADPESLRCAGGGDLGGSRGSLDNPPSPAFADRPHSSLRVTSESRLPDSRRPEREIPLPLGLLYQLPERIWTLCLESQDCLRAGSGGHSACTSIRSGARDLAFGAVKTTSPRRIDRQRRRRPYQRALHDDLRRHHKAVVACPCRVWLSRARGSDAAALGAVRAR